MNGEKRFVAGEKIVHHKCLHEINCETGFFLISFLKLAFPLFAHISFGSHAAMQCNAIALKYMQVKYWRESYGILSLDIWLHFQVEELFILIQSNVQNIAH